MNLIYILSGICLALLIATVLILIFTGGTSEPQAFTPPPFDEAATKGTPTVPAGMGWSEIYKDGMSFRANLCGEIRIRDGKAKVYFTSPESNTLWMKLRVVNTKGEILAESGLIRPGEYLEEIAFDQIPQHNERITLRIMSYQPETYYSGGAASLNTVAQLED